MDAITNMKPCPFCGHKPGPADSESTHSGDVFFYCSNCEAEGPVKSSFARAAVAWNTRTLESERDRLVDENTALQKAIKTVSDYNGRLEAENAELRERERWIPIGDIENFDPYESRHLVFHPDWGIEFGWLKGFHWKTDFLVHAEPTHLRLIQPPTDTSEEKAE